MSVCLSGTSRNFYEGEGGSKVSRCQYNDSIAGFDIESDSWFPIFQTCFITHTQKVESVICSGITCG